uniref:Uncharacterized protein n=1 Tax=Heterorhabditis bacteriophora TaxID=37862 RepID=A0A1I7WH16_HETBA
MRLCSFASSIYQISRISERVFYAQRWIYMYFKRRYIILYIYMKYL